MKTYYVMVEREVVERGDYPLPSTFPASPPVQVVLRLQPRQNRLRRP